MPPNHSQSVAFLISLGAIPLACSDGGADESAGATESASTTNASTTGNTTTESTAGTTANTTTAGTESGTATTANTTTGETTSNTTTGETTGGPGGLCGLYAQKYSDCNPRFDYGELLCYCQRQREWAEAIKPECVAAVEALRQCEVDAEGCDLLAACEAEDAALEANCSDPIPSASCMTWASKYVECAMADPGDIDDQGTYCQTLITSLIYSYGAACGLAYEELYACLGALDCATFGDEGACPDESAAADAACARSCAP